MYDFFDLEIQKVTKSPQVRLTRRVSCGVRRVENAIIHTKVTRPRSYACRLIRKVRFWQLVAWTTRPSYGISKPDERYAL